MGNCTYHYGKADDQYTLFMNHHLYLSVIYMSGVAEICIFPCYNHKYCDHFLGFAIIFEKICKSANITKSIHIRELRYGGK